jgi:hypothetical protein
VLGKVVYWLAVLVVSLVFVVALVLFFESRDQSSIDDRGATIERV